MLSGTSAQTSIPKEHRTRIWWLAGGGCALVTCACLAVLALRAGPDWLYAAAVILGAGDEPPRPSGEASDVILPPADPRPMADDNRMGDPAAPVYIVEYSDYQCPYCVRFWNETEWQIVDEYVATGKVYFEYRSMADFIGYESAAAAEAAYCAGEQGMFWEYHDVLLANSTAENVGDFAPGRLRTYAGALRMDKALFDQCLDDDRYSDRVTQDRIDGVTLGVRATPTFVINGEILEGAQSFAAFQQTIEAALAGE